MQRNFQLVLKNLEIEELLNLVLSRAYSIGSGILSCLGVNQSKWAANLLVFPRRAKVEKAVSESCRQYREDHPKTCFGNIT